MIMIVMCKHTFLQKKKEVALRLFYQKKTGKEVCAYVLELKFRNIF